ncbi:MULTISPECIES: hypothetical protein [Bacteria]|uniref:Uncharacterized protein n=1 Tax=Microbacterium phage Min1 TaxID=446529 RepID=A6N1Y3_9CAUD|nr:hypothetical protein MPMin1_gp25 [Microbacterium phage Min1]ABR10455.1 hypothetical protein [Microbacterium phage Min1]
MPRFIRRSEIAAVANRSESTVRGWIRSGALVPVMSGWYDRDAVLAVEREMRARRARASTPKGSAARVLRVSPGAWVEVTACGSHRDALDAGLIALTCRTCRIRPADAPNRGEIDEQ